MKAVLERIGGAVLRAGLMVLLLAAPSLIIPQTSPDTAAVAMVVALGLAALVFVEYYGDYPSLIEFRDAPPLNRVRFVGVFFTVLSLALICRGAKEPSDLSELFRAMGALLASAVDYWWSPVRLMVGALPEASTASLKSAMATSAGLAYFVSLLTLAVFLIVLRLTGWPARKGGFNVWTNLPLFDPTAGDDIVERLIRDARVNLILGILLPFICPLIFRMAAELFDPMRLSDEHTLLWVVTIWAFIPSSLIMRALAMQRVAQMIAAERKRAVAASQRDAWLMA